MIFPLARPRLWFLYSLAGLTIAEIEGLTAWSWDSIDAAVKNWNLPWYPPLGALFELQQRIHRERERGGEEAALAAVEQMLAAMTGPESGT